MKTIRKVLWTIRNFHAFFKKSYLCEKLTYKPYSGLKRWENVPFFMLIHPVFKGELTFFGIEAFLDPWKARESFVSSVKVLFTPFHGLHGMEKWSQEKFNLSTFKWAQNELIWSERHPTVNFQRFASVILESFTLVNDRQCNRSFANTCLAPRGQFLLPNVCLMTVSLRLFSDTTTGLSWRHRRYRRAQLLSLNFLRPTWEARRRGGREKNVKKHMYSTGQTH